METKKQKLTEGQKTAEAVVEAIKHPSFIKKEEFKPYCQTRDDWMVISIKFKRRITYEYHLSLDAYTEYKRIMKGWWQK